MILFELPLLHLDLESAEFLAPVFGEFSASVRDAV
jgi:hypothetical protein